MASDRFTRINALLQRELGGLFERLIAPQIPGVLLTVTGVEISSTLREARVYVSILKGQQSEFSDEDVLSLLHRRRTVLQKELSQRVILKYTPVLFFRQDRTAERADHVMAILKELDLPEE